jgi:hypothetical protein
MVFSSFTDVSWFNLMDEEQFLIFENLQLKRRVFQQNGLTAAVRCVCTLKKLADALSVRFLRAALLISRTQRRSAFRPFRQLCLISAIFCFVRRYL